MTAQFSVGMPDQYHDGIRPTHALWLRENDQAIWTLIDVYGDIYGNPDRGTNDSEPWETEPIRWMGNRPEQILQNGFLILALHVFRNEVLIEETNQRLPALLEPGYVDLWKLDPAVLDDLHQLTMDTELPGKVVVTVLGGSSLEPQLPLLRALFDPTRGLHSDLLPYLGRIHGPIRSRTGWLAHRKLVF